MLNNEAITAQLAPVRNATVALAFVPPPEATKFKLAIFTGFGVECNGRVFWVTAAHVLHELDDAFKLCPAGTIYLKGLSNNSVSVQFRKIDDTWIDIGQMLKRLNTNGNLVLRGDPIDAEIFDEMDAGVAYIPRYYVDNLKADGFVPLPIEDLSFPTEEEVDAVPD